jgi:hypothetical protein
MIAPNDIFETIAEAHKAISRHILNDGESYKVYDSDTKFSILRSWDGNCASTITTTWEERVSLHERKQKADLIRRNSFKTITDFAAWSWVMWMRISCQGWP